MRKFARVTHARRIQRDLGLFVAPLSKTADEPPPPPPLLSLNPSAGGFECEKRFAEALVLPTLASPFKHRTFLSGSVPQELRKFQRQEMLFWVNEFVLNFAKEEGVGTSWKFWLFRWCETPTQNLKKSQMKNFAFSSRT